VRVKPGVLLMCCKGLSVHRAGCRYRKGRMRLTIREGLQRIVDEMICSCRDSLHDPGDDHCCLSIAREALGVKP